jgi:hypothetical protein
VLLDDASADNVYSQDEYVRRKRSKSILAITSFPVPVSPWIKTAQSTGATLSTSVINARNFGLDPIKSKLVIALFLYECEIFSAFSYDQASMR